MDGNKFRAAFLALASKVDDKLVVSYVTHRRKGIITCKTEKARQQVLEALRAQEQRGDTRLIIRPKISTSEAMLRLPDEL
eukprot:101501-Prorocentrum_lima.AAC.1